MSKPVGPYSPVMRAGDTLYVSGQIGQIDGVVVEGGVRAQLEQALSNLVALLGSEGVTLDQVAKTTVFLTDMNDYAAMNEVYIAAFGDHRPARSAVAVAALPLGALIEMEAIVHLG